MDRPRIAEADLAKCLSVLAAAEALSPEDPMRAALERASAALTKSAKKKRRIARRQAKSEHARAVSARAGRMLTSAPDVGTYEPAPAPRPPAGELLRDRRCYVCKGPYRTVHSFYHWLCPACAAENQARRGARADLQGRRAFVTGGRIKIGFHLVLKLLRDGAHVTMTTRFPRDAARRFAAVPDARDFQGRLRIVGIDLRLLPRVIELAEQLAGELQPFDIVVNNAAQTVWRPAEYYKPWILGESEPLDGIAALLPLVEAPLVAAGLPGAERASQAPVMQPGRCTLASPEGALDVEGLPLDLRPENSWRLTIEDVGIAELLETHVVNAIVPFLLTSRLLASMRRSLFPDRYVVHVSAAEGQFERTNKTAFHPHTNMAKAALNMMTRTSAAALSLDGIHMTSVDTGWITDEDPAPRRERKRERGFCPPLDVIDGAARVYDPIVRGVRGERMSGVLLKDYCSAPW